MSTASDEGVRITGDGRFGASGLSGAPTLPPRRCTSATVAVGTIRARAADRRCRRPAVIASRLKRQCWCRPCRDCLSACRAGVVSASARTLLGASCSQCAARPVMATSGACCQRVRVLFLSRHGHTEIDLVGFTSGVHGESVRLSGKHKSRLGASRQGGRLWSGDHAFKLAGRRGGRAAARFFEGSASEARLLEGRGHVVLVELRPRYLLDEHDLWARRVDQLVSCHPSRRPPKSSRAYSSLRSPGRRDAASSQAGLARVTAVMRRMKPRPCSDAARSKVELSRVMRVEASTLR